MKDSFGRTRQTDDHRAINSVLHVQYSSHPCVTHKHTMMNYRHRLQYNLTLPYPTPRHGMHTIDTETGRQTESAPQQQTAASTRRWPQGTTEGVKCPTYAHLVPLRHGVRHPSHGGTAAEDFPSRRGQAHRGHGRQAHLDQLIVNIMPYPG